MNRRALIAALLAAPAAMAAECKYKRVDSGAVFPKEYKTIAIPIFRNPSLRFRVEQRVTDAMTRAVLRRAPRLRIVSDTSEADLVLTGEIKDFRSGGALLDDTGRTRVFQVVVVAAITLRDLKQDAVLFDNQRMVFRGEYELSGEPESFFDEEDPAVDRIANDFAESAVSTILYGSLK